MSQYYHHLCARNIGRMVQIRDRFGRVHRGVIHRVSRTHVFIRPIRPAVPRGFGYGLGYRRFGRPFFRRRFAFGAAIGIALGAIIAFSLIPFAFF
ncbi:hypothetical protein [Aeribacillus pallidus]|uniref:hypothetical protein n=1 Tax=Aeribacillus pallidus TaxID=33936 RepID=UPI003D199F48